MPGLFDGMSMGGLFGDLNQRATPFTQNNQNALLGAGLALMGGDGYSGAARGFMAGGLADSQRAASAQQSQMAKQRLAMEQERLGMARTQFQNEQTAAERILGQENKTRQLAIKMGLPEEVAMNAPIDALTQRMFPKPTSPSAFNEKLSAIKAANPNMSDAEAVNMAVAPVQTVKNITEGPQIGTLPKGFSAVEDPNDPSGYRMYPVPGGPEDTTKQDQVKAGQAAVATRVVTSAAQRAREAAKNRQLGGFGQGVVATINPYSDSAEVQRQVDVLKSNAKIENLNAMRAASPTGGALGSVTEKESDMLAAKSGALNPSSPNFERDLADYELTLLQIVHGPEIGRQIFDATRAEGGATADSDVESLIDRYGSM